MSSSVLACPHCAGALIVAPSGATCANGHAFDRAREGYLNLTVGGRLRSGATSGDPPDSLAARRRFLATGAYAPIADALAGAIGRPDGPVLDVGCGEGWYLSHLMAGAARATAGRARAAGPEWFGLDVSKRAVQLASRAVPDATFVVGSAHRLPVLDASLAVVFSVFAPHPVDEFARVLRPGGHWVTVTPGPGHLREMRPAPQGAAEERAAAREDRRGAAPVGATQARRLEFTVDLDAATASDLFAMTPIRWQRGAAVDAARTTRAVSVDVWVAWSGPMPMPMPMPMPTPSPGSGAGMSAEPRPADG